MKKQIITTAAAMAVTALMAFQPMTAFAATGNCGNGSYHNGCSTQVCRAMAAIPATVVPAIIPV